MATQTDERVVTIKNVRLSFCNGLREKTKSHPDAKPKHSCSFILDPSVAEHPANLKAVKKAIAAAEVKEFGAGKEGIIGKSVQDNKRIVFREGNTFTNEDGETYQGYDVEGAYGLGSCKSDKRPKLFDRKKNPVEAEDIDDVFQAGQFCDAIVSFYCTSKKEQGGRGLFASVQLIRARQTGETFGAGNNASADDLDDLDDDGIDGDDDLLG
jgi:hypothetical protein